MPDFEVTGKDIDDLADELEDTLKNLSNPTEIQIVNALLDYLKGNYLQSEEVVEQLRSYLEKLGMQFPKKKNPKEKNKSNKDK